MGVADHGVAVDLLEGHLTGELDAKEDHAGDPEEDNVPAGLEERSRIEASDVLRLVVESGQHTGWVHPGFADTARTLFGQPRMAKGQRPEENQVSRTSSS